MLRHFGDWQMELSEVGSEREYNLLDMIIRGVESEPTAFDLESVIAELEKKSNEVLSNTFCYEEDDHEGIYNDGVSDGLEEAIEILKSAANATNGKIGG